MAMLFFDYACAKFLTVGLELLGIAGLIKWANFHPHAKLCLHLNGRFFFAQGTTILSRSLKCKTENEQYKPPTTKTARNSILLLGDFYRRVTKCAYASVLDKIWWCHRFHGKINQSINYAAI